MHLKRKTAVDCSLTVNINGDAYTARHIPTDSPEVIKAWRLSKDESDDAYVVADTIDGSTSECASYIFRHMGKDQTGCKHIQALRKLTLIDPVGDSADEWPAWTDTHAFAARR
jgi:hypothetical protein